MPSAGRVKRVVRRGGCAIRIATALTLAQWLRGFGELAFSSRRPQARGGVRALENSERELRLRIRQRERPLPLDSLEHPGIGDEALRVAATDTDEPVDVRGPPTHHEALASALGCWLTHVGRPALWTPSALHTIPLFSVPGIDPSADLSIRDLPPRLVRSHTGRDRIASLTRTPVRDPTIGRRGRAVAHG